MYFGPLRKGLNFLQKDSRYGLLSGFCPNLSNGETQSNAGFDPAFLFEPSFDRWRDPFISATPATIAVEPAVDLTFGDLGDGGVALLAFLLA